jgi:predicted Ser/Thr protein kinase
MVDSFTPQASLIGVKLGKYAVHALIGRGAMATVYLAKDTDLGRPVALKVLLGSMARNPEQVRRFQMEALAAAPLQHPNIVRIYDAGILSGVPFISMEYVEGEPLERLLQRSGAVPWHHALMIAQQIADALDCAHRAGIVHRDVKPANILLDRQGRVRLSDFGIANIAHRPMKPSPETEFLGTPEYMSPEQCAGSSDLAPSTDLFSLGVTLFRMLSAQMPFQGASTVALINSIAEDAPPRLNQIVQGLPDDVARLVAHLLEKERHQRPASARWVSDQIGRLLRENGGTSALPEALNAFIKDQSQPRKLRTDTPTPLKAPRGPRIEFIERRMYYAPVSAMAKGLAAALVVLAGLGVGYWHFLRDAAPLQAATEMPGSSFAESTRGVWKAGLPAEHWVATSLHWAGESQRLLVRCEGTRGTLAQGAAGVLAYDMDTRAVYSVDAPSGPAMNIDHWNTQPPGAWPGQMPAMPLDAPLRDAFVRPVYGDGDQGGRVLLVPHPVRAAAPRAQALLACEPLSWMLPSQGPGTTPWAGQVALSPDGHTLCSLLRDPANGTSFLAEHDARWAGNDTELRPLIQGGDPIVPGSVQYAPAGNLIAFVRARADGDRSLWVVQPGRSESALPVHVGPLGLESTFSPDGRYIAFNVEAEDGPRVVLAETTDGQVIAQLGPGRATQESFHPSGRYLVITAEDETTGSPQLVAVSTDAPFQRQALTNLEEGVLLGGAVSRDGRWTAAALASGELAFIDLSAQLFVSQPMASHPMPTVPPLPEQGGPA